jgi:5-carboxymethyl-2-hydroxymuconate isomerase
MPHVELKYSDNLKLNSTEIFDTIETVVNTLDSSTGNCKSRAYPTTIYKHSHLLISISLLTKPHRDDAFSQQLSHNILAAIQPLLNTSAALSIELRYMNDSYITTQIEKY